MPVPAVKRRDRRGPLRPRRLLARHARTNGALLARSFRAVDVATVGVLAWLACDLAIPAGVLAGRFAAVAPFACGVGALAVSLHVLGAYAFRPRETLAAHLGRIAAAFGFTLGVTTTTLVAARAGERAWSAEAIWLGLSFASLYLLHVWWWFNVCRLRSSGRLTPNVVIVGATENAERLIGKALESRDVAVLGVFDDRRERTPQAVNGVPVLGDVQALIEHRIIPCVDLVVVAITASAEARVQTLVDRLRVLPKEIIVSVDFAAAAGFGRPLSQLADARAAAPQTPSERWRCDPGRNPRRGPISRARATLGRLAALPQRPAGPSPG